jgi:hypothetical protein
MDYRIYHAINQFVYHHAWLGRALNLLENWAVPAIAIATFALWLLARPGGSRKWKLACASALASAALALLVNQLIGRIWHRQRPFATHPSAHVWGSRTHDPVGCQNSVRAPRNQRFAGRTLILAPHTSFGTPQVTVVATNSLCPRSFKFGRL